MAYYFIGCYKVCLRSPIHVSGPQIWRTLPKVMKLNIALRSMTLKKLLGCIFTLICKIQIGYKISNVYLSSYVRIIFIFKVKILWGSRQQNKKGSDHKIVVWRSRGCYWLYRKWIVSRSTHNTHSIYGITFLYDHGLK